MSREKRERRRERRRRRDQWLWPALLVVQGLVLMVAGVAGRSLPAGLMGAVALVLGGLVLAASFRTGGRKHSDREKLVRLRERMSRKK